MGMTTCCFCFDLKHGTLAVGIFTVTTRVLAMVVFAILLGLAHQNPNKSGSEDMLLFIDIIAGTVIAESIVAAFFGALLIVGVQKTIRGLFIPWMVLSALDIVSNAYFFFGSVVYIAAGGMMILQAFGCLVGTVFLCYMWWCVLAYYKSLGVQGNLYQNFTNEGCKEVETSPPAPAMQMPPPPAYTERDTKHIV